MTEPEWLICSDPKPLLDFSGAKASGRKLRLFAAASVRPYWNLLIDARSRTAVELAERVADGTNPSEDLSDARRRAWDVLLLDAIDEGPPVSAARAAEGDACRASHYATNEVVELQAELVEPRAASAAVAERSYWQGRSEAKG